MGSRLTIPPRPADRSIGEAVAAVLSPDCRRTPTVAAKAASLRAAIAAFYRANEGEWLMFHDFKAKFGGRPDGGSRRAARHGRGWPAQARPLPRPQGARELHLLRGTGAVSALRDQHGGSHYRDLAIQPVQYIHANGIDFMAGSAIKYLTRHRSKGGADDIRKAMHFCRLILELEYGEAAGKLLLPGEGE